MHYPEFLTQWDINKKNKLEKIYDYAKAKEVTVDEYHIMVSQCVKKMLAGTAIFIRVGKYFENVIYDERFKNIHETRHSSGYSDLWYRKLVEHKILNIPLDFEDSKRPIYGYLSKDKEHLIRRASKYGDVIFELKGYMKNRTYFTFGDSLDGDAWPEPIVNSNYSIFTSDEDHLAIDGFDDVWPYTEAQIVGGVSLKDVKKIIFTHERKITSDLLNKIKTYNIILEECLVKDSF